MSTETLKTYLDPAIAKMERVYQELLKTQGYNSETEKLMILIELLKEQKRNEDSHHSIG